MNSTTYITLDLQAPNFAVMASAKQNDTLGRQIAATLRDGSAPFYPQSAIATIRYAKPDGTVGWYDTLEDNTTPAYTISGNVITFTLAEQMLTVAGAVYAEINFYAEGEGKLTTFAFVLQVEASVLADGTIVSSDYYNVLTAKIDAFLGAAVNPPIIDPITKDWLLWDVEAGDYVDSGYSSIGAVGPAPSITSSVEEFVVSDDGVTIPATGWDTAVPTVTAGAWLWCRNTVTYANGDSVVSYWSAYQGQDGQGAPSSATPLIDNGSGIVGTAIAYARGDHQHPLNVSTDAPSDVGNSDAGESSFYARADHSHAYNYSLIFDAIYPVGSIYMSVANINPAAVFGGTWERITGRFLLAATDNGNSGASQAAGNTGGEATHLLTAAESGLPSHHHTVQYRNLFQSGSARAGVYQSGTADGIWNTSNAGGTNASAAHNNMPPYLSVYVWKRTA